ncbi:TetR/AcrR family transcriptional regulator [Streptomyces sp. NPDC057638]|uniref:TetR/AcrR family transcriptional regulator n=1 Tax=Streptomyces sp. NPDC057638 TaxID=3346190 RepID=UPI0036A7141A
MATARESLLNAALLALDELPWSAVRMVDVAAAAGLSRQTLYNEFGSKDGLARALLWREADRYLHGVDRLLGERDGVVDPLAAVAEWTVRQARDRPLLRALLTGCWGERMPRPKPGRRGAAPTLTLAQRRVDAGLPVPGEVVALVRDRSLAVLARQEEGGAEYSGEDAGTLAARCELAVRLALSYVIAPVQPGHPGPPWSAAPVGGVPAPAGGAEGEVAGEGRWEDGGAPGRVG